MTFTLIHLIPMKVMNKVSLCVQRLITFLIPNDFLDGSQTSTLTDDSNISDDADPVTCPKYIIFDQCLNQLLKRCPECGSVITEISKTVIGSTLNISLTCLNHHYVNGNPLPQFITIQHQTSSYLGVSSCLVRHIHNSTTSVISPM